MKPGLHADDGFMMVEDEFLTTARLFTSHLHHAEYKRLKSIALSNQSPRALRVMRATTAGVAMSQQEKFRLEREGRERRQKEVIGNILEGESDSEDEGVQIFDQRLRGLMAQPKALSANLEGLVGSKSNTRAAAGFQKASQGIEKDMSKKSLGKEPRTIDLGNSMLRPKTKKVEKPVDLPRDEKSKADDVDSLRAREPQQTRPNSLTKPTKPTKPADSIPDIIADAPALRPTKPFKPSEPTTMKPRLRPISASQSSNPRTTAARIPAMSGSTSSKPSAAASNPTKPLWDFDAFDDFPKRQSQSALFLAKRKSEAAKKEREERRKSILLDEIPTFLV